MCVLIYVWEENRKKLRGNKKEGKKKLERNENQKAIETDLETGEVVITAGGSWFTIDKKTWLLGQDTRNEVE